MKRFLLSLVLCSILPAAAAPVINEFLAINHGPSFDDFAETSDWIEIRNPGPGSVDLAGWTLTDEPDLPAKWTFPAVILGEGDLLLVRASGRDLRNAGQVLHTNFTLSGGGEFLGLYSPENVAATVWQPYPRQFSGISYGFDSNSGAPGYMTVPTPEDDNPLNVLSDYVRDTRFSMDRGFFTAPFSVVLTCDTPGAEIRYTLDGSVPGESSALYAGPVSITTTKAMRVRAFKAGMLPSNVDTQTYIFPAVWKAQPDFPPGFSQSWGAFEGNQPGTKVLADYGMNTSVTNDATYGPLVIPAMTQTFPVVCITGGAAEIFGDAGIHGNLRNTDAEVPVSVEYFNPLAPGEKFTACAGLNAHGGAVRNFAKKGFRLDFTGVNGDGPLKFPLFAGSPVESFDQLVLRTGGHDSFTVRVRGGSPDNNDLAFHASYVRDQFLRRTEVAAGLLSPRGRWVHLCINGLYWGLYDLHERPNAEWSAEHAGGPAAAWDVLHHNNTSSSLGPQLLDGTMEDWNALQALSLNPVVTNAAYQQLAALLGPENFIDHLLIRMWAGDHDWMGPAYMPSSTQGTTADVAVFSGKNWYAARGSRQMPAGQWRFFTWDGEISMGNHLLFRWFDSLPTPAGLGWPHLREVNLDLTGIVRANTPAAPWNALRSHPEFRLKVADRAHRLLHNDGLLAPAVAAARLEAMRVELDPVIVAESARWGSVAGIGFRRLIVDGPIHRTWDNEGNITFTRDTHWRPEIAWLRDTFAAQRAGILKNQLAARGLWPATEPVSMTPPGGPREDVLSITLTVPAGDVYWTWDGTDPRVEFTGAVAPGAQLYTGPFPGPGTPDVAYTVKARALNGGGWSALTEAHFTVTAVAPTPGALAITEIHYHPADATLEEAAALGFSDGDAFEFLEITNVSNDRVKLESLRFASGVDFDFAEHSAVRELGPGSSLVIGSHAAAVQLRYGFAPAGVFANGTRLSNSGERIKLVTVEGVVIAEVTYNDTGEWPAAADGGGRSLELLAPFSGTVEDDADHWRASTVIGGTPRTIAGITYAAWLGDYFTAAEIADPLVTGALANPEGDGMANATEYATRTNPRKSSNHPVKVSALPGGGVRFTWERRADALDVAGVLQVSTNMQSWKAASGPGIMVSEANTTRGTIRQTVDCTAATGIRFARLRVTLTQ